MDPDEYTPLHPDLLKSFLIAAGIVVLIGIAVLGYGTLLLKYRLLQGVAG